ncbi:MAG: hypothetical protein KC912_06240 [Proteobacteria bacterium]|nr:hypothetical protein [Pseudomonadota bacterium]
MIGALIALSLGAPVVEQAQAPSLAFQAVRSQHFEVHYARSRGEDQLLAAERVLAEAEAAWLPLCAEIEYFPVERTHILLLPDDGMQGWTWPSWDWIVLSAHPGGTLELQRGPMDPLRLILRHELAHLLHLKKSKWLAESVQSVEVSASVWSGRRNTRVDAGLEFAGIGPYWWSEGSAEALVINAGLGEVGAEREATLRTSLTEYRWLGEEWRTRFEKQDWGDSERSYQQGRAFVHWLEATEGLRIAELSDDVARTGSVTRSLRRLTGSTQEQLVDGFVAQIDVAGRERGTAGAELEEHVKPTPRRSDAAEDARERTGVWDLWPTPSPDGRWYAQHDRGVVRVERREASSFAALGGDGPADLDRIVIPVHYGSRFTFVPGEQAVVVVGEDALTGLDLSVRNVSRLVRVDLSGDETSLGTESWGISTPRSLRKRSTPVPGTEHAWDPAVSSDGELAWIRVSEGGGQLMRGPLSGPFSVVAGESGHWWRTPVFLPDGRLIAIHRVGDRADIVEVHGDRALTALTSSLSQEAELSVTPDGQVLFTADLEGFRDVFSLDPDTGEVRQLTERFGGAHTPAMTADGDLLFVETTAHGFKAMGIEADALLDRTVSDPFTGHPLSTAVLPVPDYEAVSGRGLVPWSITPFAHVGMGGVDDLDLVGGAVVSTRSWHDAFDGRLTLWVGEELGAATQLRQRLGPLDLRIAALHGISERPVNGVKLESSQSEASVDLGLRRGPFAVWTGGRAARVGFRDLGAVGLAAGRVSLLATEVSRGGLMAEGVRAELSAEVGQQDGNRFWRGWFDVSADARLPRELGAAWRRHHALLVGLHVAAADPTSHPWLRPRAGGMGRESLLGSVTAFPGYPELAFTGDALVVAKLGYRLPLGRWRRAAGAWFIEGASLEGMTHVGQAWSAGSVPGLDDGITGTPWAGDVGGRLIVHGTVRDSRWDLGIRVAVPLTGVPVSDIDGDDVFDVLPAPAALRDELPSPRFMLEFGRL